MKAASEPRRLHPARRFCSAVRALVSCRRPRAVAARRQPGIRESSSAISVAPDPDPGIRRVHPAGLPRHCGIRRTRGAETIRRRSSLRPSEPTGRECAGETERTISQNPKLSFADGRSASRRWAVSRTAREVPSAAISSASVAVKGVDAAATHHAGRRGRSLRNVRDQAPQATPSRVLRVAMLPVADEQSSAVRG